MSSSTKVSSCFPPFFSFLLLFNVSGGAASTFAIVNRCLYTVWPAAVPGGGLQLDPGQSWTLSVGSNVTNGRIWARTNCSFNSTGNGRCQTGDCEGLLACQAYGSQPATLAEFSLDQFPSSDYFDISLVDGFNVPMEFSPSLTSNCSSGRGPRCAADVTAECPEVLRAPGGCNSPCMVFKTDEYCCNSAGGGCKPTNYSMIFKRSCPDAYTYPLDNAATFTCPSGADYTVVFCPEKMTAELAGDDTISTGFGELSVKFLIPPKLDDRR